MTDQTPMPRIWIYNDANCASFFKENSSLFQNSSPELIIEISQGPVFAHYFNMESPANFPGIAGLLNAENTPLDFAMQVIDSDYPILFAPAQPSSPTILGSALRAIMHHPERPARTDIFIELGLLEDLLPWLHGFSGIGIVYGLASAPSPTLMETIKKLCNEELLSSAEWLGFKAYFSDPVPPTEEEQGLIEKSLESLPGGGLIHTN